MSSYSFCKQSFCFFVRGIPNILAFTSNFVDVIKHCILVLPRIYGTCTLTLTHTYTVFFVSHSHMYVRRNKFIPFLLSFIICLFFGYALCILCVFCISLCFVFVFLPFSLCSFPLSLFLNS